MIAQTKSGGSAFGLLFALLVFIAVLFAFVVFSGSQTATIPAANLSVNAAQDLNWSLQPELNPVNLNNDWEKKVVGQWVAISAATAWQSIPAGANIPDLPDPNEFCKQHEIQLLTGKPCEWIKQVSFKEDGTEAYRFRLVSGEYEISEVEIQELQLNEYSEITEITSSSPVYGSAETGWFEYIKVAEWARGIGLGKLLWEIVNTWTANLNGGQAVRIVADASAIKWVPALLEKAVASGSIGNVQQLGEQLWIFTTWTR